MFFACELLWNRCHFSDYKNGNQEKPKQLFWEKRLEGLRACDIDGVEFDAMQLPKGLKPVGPNVTEETIIQSVATALHVTSSSVTGRLTDIWMIMFNRFS